MARRHSALDRRHKPPPPRHPAPPPVQVTVQTTVVPVGPKLVFKDSCAAIFDAEVAKVVAALAKAANLQFALPPPFGYGIGVQSFRVLRLGEVPAADEWVMEALDHPDVEGAYGYHDMTPSGMPIMRIFPPLDIAEGNPWSVTADHELKETLADPMLRRGAQDNDGVWWAYENCDGVEADKYQFEGVWLSNFALPPYFEPPPNLTGVKLDWMGLCKHPFETRPGGYNQKWTGSKWVEVLGSKIVERRGVRKLLGDRKRADKGHVGRGLRRRLRG